MNILRQVLLAGGSPVYTHGTPDITGPTGTMTQPSPTPRNSDVATITITFSEPVTGFTVEDMTLKLDGGADLLTGSESLTSSDGGRTWVLGGLSFITEDEGTYVLELIAAGSGIVDADGNELSGDVSTTWDVDLTLPTVAITAVTPDPIDVPVDEIEVVFSEAVSGVSLSRFTLKRDGGPNLLTGAQTISTADYITYTIENLAPLTGTDGQYVLAIIASENAIFDTAGNGLLGTDSETWVLDTATPPTVAITAVSPDPRSDAVDEITIVFSEAVENFTVADLTLTLTRDAVPLGSILTGDETLTSGDDITWTLGNLEPITHGRGDYLLTILPGAIASIATGKALQVGDTEAWEAIVEPWVPSTKTFRTVNMTHNSVLSAAQGGALGAVNLALGAGAAVTNAGGLYQLNIPSLGGQDWRTGDWVRVVSVTGATAANGFWQITKTGATTFTLDGSTWDTNGTGGTATRWIAAGFDQVQVFQLIANQARGQEQGVQGGAFSNFLVPYNIQSGIKPVGGAALVSGEVRITVTSHGYSSGNVVELDGINTTLAGQTFQGVWTITVVDANTFSLNGAVWPTGATYVANTGICRLHSVAKLQREYILTGGPDNGAATTITSQAGADGTVRGYKQGLRQWRDWLREHIDGGAAGFYMSASNVATPEAVLDRGQNASYPFALVQMNEDYVNGWGVVSSNSNSGNVRLTLTKTPKSAWAGQVRCAMFGHSNPSYGIDRYMDDSSSGFSRLVGLAGTATGGSTTTLTQANAFNASQVLGSEILFLSGPPAGKRKTITGVSGNTVTFGAISDAVTAGTTFLITMQGPRILSVNPATNQITLDSPYRSEDGTGGCLLLFGAATGIGLGAARPGGGNYARLTTAVAHGFEQDDYVLLGGMSGAGRAAYNFTSGAGVNNTSNRVTVHKVVTVISDTVVDLDVAYAGVATGGTWFGTCLSLASATTPGSTTMSGTRIDQPDYRRSDVREMFVQDLKDLIDAHFARDGAFQIGVFDECSMRHGPSAAQQTIAISGSLNGETTLELIERVGDVIQHIKDEWCRTAVPNCTGWLTKDALSVAERNAIIAQWGGMLSEVACMLWDRSVYQMVDGYLAHLEAMTDAGLIYDYQTQSPAAVTKPVLTSSSGEGGRVQLVFDANQDPGTFPTASESSSATAHNHSGSVIGLYGHSVASLNGVHRVWKRTLDGATGRHILTLETRYPGSNGSGGTIVHYNSFAPMKVTQLTDNGSGAVRVTTEFPHHLPDPDDAQALVYFYGYGGTGEPANATGYVATKVGANTFDIAVTPSGSYPKGVGICFWGSGGSLTGDHNHFLGLCWMLWNASRALRLNLSSLAFSVNPWVAQIPSDLSADEDYQVDTFSGTADSGSTTTMTDAASAFTDAVLGEMILFTSGPNANAWRRITAVNSATQITFDAFSNAVASGHQFVIGKTATTDVDKVLQLSREFNSGARRVEVYPQKSQVKYTGSWN